jgi:RimJ/RimL family protein N-acetyltransferase
MPGPVFLDGDRLALRTVESDDYEFIHRHWNEPSIRHGTSKYRPANETQIADFLEESEDAVHFLPCDDGKPVGFLWLFRIDDVASRAEIGYWIVPGERGNGYATEAARLGIRYAFDERGLRKLMARVFEGNDSSTRILERVGFQQEGCLRDHYYVDGDYVDTYLYSLLVSER